MIITVNGHICQGFQPSIPDSIAEKFTHTFVTTCPNYLSSASTGFNTSRTKSQQHSSKTLQHLYWLSIMFYVTFKDPIKLTLSGPDFHTFQFDLNQTSPVENRIWIKLNYGLAHFKCENVLLSGSNFRTNQWKFCQAVFRFGKGKKMQQNSARSIWALTAKLHKFQSGEIH